MMHLQVRGLPDVCAWLRRDKPRALVPSLVTSACVLPWCASLWQATKQAVMLQLQESWLRPYQVLPLRTHPNMMCAGTGGFILSGIKVVVAPAPAPAPGAAAPGASTDAAAAAGGPGSDSNASKRAKR